MRKELRDWFIYLVFTGLILAFLALIGRLIYIEIRLAPFLREYAYKQYRAFRPLVAIRGTIYDRRGRILAGTKLVPSLFADPFIVEDKLTLADVLSAILDEKPEEIYRILTSRPDSRFVWIKRGISHELAESIRRLPLRGIGIIKEPVRFYPGGELAGHVLGAVDISGRGIEGIELYYDNILRGEDGLEVYIKDVAGRKLWLLEDKCRPAVNGKHIVLTIDAVIQQFTQQVLGEILERYSAEAAIGIVIDPKSGEILALSVVPEIDPNRFGSYPARLRRNRAVTDPYEPGSVFKPFIAAAALEAGKVGLTERIFCHNGEYRIGRRVLHDYHPYGYLDFAGIIIHSSNIGMAILGQRMGKEGLYNAVRRFGFGSKTGIDLPGEDEGIVRDPTKWNEYSITSIPMGQEIATTAIQLAVGFSALANGGLLLRPHLLRGGIDNDGKVFMRNESHKVVRGRAISERIARYMVKEILRRVVIEGTGKAADLKGYMVFGKTGTAQVARRDGRGYEAGSYIATFVGGAPADDPKVVVLVSVIRPDPKKGHFGGTVAAPAVKEIIKKCFEYWNIGPIELDLPKESIKFKG